MTEKKLVVWDVETYPNCFTLAAEHVDYPLTWAFEISDFRDDSKQIIEWLSWLRNNGYKMVGFNNVGFDYPVLHTLVQTGKATARSLYDKAMAIINSQETNRFVHMVYPSDRCVEQIDLYKIHHFDNKARATSLKVLEFNMRLGNVSDLPFPVGTVLNQDQVRVLKVYNAHDVTATKAFYHHSLEMIDFRDSLTVKYSRDFTNHNDTKIGKDYLIMSLEAAGVSCYTYGSSGRTPRQTKRPSIALKDAILPWIRFNHPELTRILDWLKCQTIVETKGVFENVTAAVDGFELVFGTGGLHGSIESSVVESDDTHVLIDLDVSSYYPNIAIANRLYPEHLGEKFCDIYEGLYIQRQSYAKGSAENAMMKLGLNGVFGDSNSPFSVFFDSLFTMSITLNGQLLLCLLIEKIMACTNAELIQVNTDGITVRIPRDQKNALDAARRDWETITKLQLEEATYSKMFIRDVNNYLAVYANGKVKRKGAYEYKLGWHQNHGGLVIAKVAEKVLVGGVSIRETLESHEDKMDFMLRVKVTRGSRLVTVVDGADVELERTQRYYIAKGGTPLFKIMPPLAKKPGVYRRLGVESGWGVCVCNNIADATLPIDYSYYQNEIEKLTLGVM